MRPPRAAPSTRRPFQPLGGRAASATAVFGLLLVLDVVAVGASFLEVGLLDRVAAGENVTDAQWEANDTRQMMIGLGQFGLWVACAVTFIRWLHRGYVNMDAISPPYRRFDTGWAIGAWFVPFLNLWRPKQIVNDVWRSGLPSSQGPPWWLGVWWAGWIVSNILGRIAFPELGENPTLEEMRQDSVNYMISDGFDIAVLALAIVTIRVITTRQEAKADAVAAAPPQSTTPLPRTAATPPQPASPGTPQQPASSEPAEPQPA